MKLAEYISKQGMTHAEFGALIGVPQATVSRYVNGVRIPHDKETFDKIFEATGGQVTPNDFFDTPTQAEAAE